MSSHASCLEGEPRLTWQECPEDIQRLEIGNYRALVIHGDEVGRNGFASPSTIANWVVRQKSGAYPWAFRELLFCTTTTRTLNSRCLTVPGRSIRTALLSQTTDTPA